MEGFESSTVRANFRPEYAQCPRHGRWQSNRLDEAGVIRFLAHCPLCDREKIIARAAIPSRFEGREFGNYIVELPGQRLALAAARDYAEHFAERRRAGTCLVFTGRPGTGKSHLAIAIAVHVMRQGYSALYRNAYDVIRAVRDTWRRDASRSEEDVLGSFAGSDLLILDEVGAPTGPGGEQCELFKIINRRYERVAPTIVISNQNRDGLLACLGERAFDRLRENGGRLIVFDWPSFRARCVSGLRKDSPNKEKG